MVNTRQTDLKSSVLSKTGIANDVCNRIDSPRPYPTFFFKEQTFSTKKERQTPREKPPPTPRPRTTLKSCPPINRIFSHIEDERAHSVSFRDDSKLRLSSKYYNENSRTPYFNQCFDVICKLGSGSFGEVFKVRSKEDGKYYAIKRSKERFKGKSDRRRKLEEVKKHEQLPKHQNCVKFYRAWEEKQFLYIQTELCETSLSEYSEIHHDIPEETVWNYLVDLLLAVRHLHNHDLIHLDIKPDNIFISEDGICKLGDFGLVLDVSKKDVTDALEGDPKYLAPELMQGTFTKAADIFSLGITILELACDLDLPRGDNAWHQLRQGQIPTEFTNRLSPELNEVIHRLMEPEYKDRPSVHEVLQMKAVTRVYRKRKLVLKLKAIATYVMLSCHWLVFSLLWIRSSFMNLFSSLSRTQSEVSTPTRTDRPTCPDWDYSFSDEDVFEPERRMGRNNLNDSSSIKPSALVFDDDTPPKSHLFVARNHERGSVTTPPAFKYWESGIVEPAGSPLLRGSLSSRMSSSPKSVRRSPRLAAKVDLNESQSIGPRNLMSAFEEYSTTED